LAEVNKLIGNTHLGYGHSPSLTGMPQIEFTFDGDVFVLLRETAAVLVSHYYYITDRKDPRSTEIISNYKIGDLCSFIRGPYGVERICHYLNNVQHRSSNRDNFVFLFYEDAFNKEFIRVIPRMLGVNYKLSEEEVDYIHSNTDFQNISSGSTDRELGSLGISIRTQLGNKKMRIGTPDSYKESLGVEDLDYITGYLEENCLLPQYRERYL
jgi:hypothetical protein